MVIMLAAVASRLGRTRLARQALAEGADLAAFKQRPTPRILLGVFLIFFSYPMGWPAVGAMGALALALNKPWIAVVGGPLVYGLSHLVFLLGMFLAGRDYTKIFFKWALRVFVEKYHPPPLPVSSSTAIREKGDGNLNPAPPKDAAV